MRIYLVNIYILFHVKENIISSEICKKCAECCKNYPYVELSINEIKSLEHLTGLYLNDFTNQKGKAVEEYFFKFQKNGDCIFLNESNGIHSCAVYETRPSICRNYPSKPKQKETCEANKAKLLTSFAHKVTAFDTCPVSSTDKRI